MDLQLAKVGMYTRGAGSTGPWRYVHSILRGFDPAEFEVVVFSDMPGERYEPRPCVRNVPLTPVFPENQGGCDGDRFDGLRTKALGAVPPFAKLWAGFAGEARQLAGRFRRYGIDMIHTNSTGCEEAPLAARLAGIGRVLGTFHVDSTYDLHGKRGGLAHRVLEHISNHSLDRAIGVSAATSRDWVRRTHLSPTRVVTIHNGIDPEQFRRRETIQTARAALGLPSDDRPIVAGVGRLEEAKGFEYLIDAFALVHAHLPNALLVLAGQGPLRPSLQERADRHGLGGQVAFLGFCKDIQRVYDAIDVLALSSLCEALPYAVLEAMASRLPVVATAVGGVPEMVVDGQTGLLVPPRDSKALAAALLRVLDAPDLRDRMGAAGRARVEKHFTEREMVVKTINLYRSLLRERTGFARSRT